MLRIHEQPGPERLAGFAVTDRVGGASGPPYQGLNLALHVGDDRAAVLQNRARVAAELAVPRLAWMDQVHGRAVAQVDAAYPDSPGGPAQVDALVTRQRGLALAVLVADCTPVLAADPWAGVVGVAHAGRRGLQLGVVPALIAAMRDLGAHDIVAVIGPSICGRCYRVPLALQEEVAAGCPAASSTARDGSPSLDIAAGVAAQLAELGVPVDARPGCSAEDPGLFSYRRDGGVTGRYAGFAWLP